MTQHTQEDKLTLLLVEDNHEIACQLSDYLALQGIIVDYAENGHIALALLEENVFDVVILDLMLPDYDGFTLCQRIKERVNYHLPILMLTARDSLNDKLTGFTVGADDYLTKPFALEEVYMRCIALSRRVLLHQDKAIQLGDLTIDIGQRTAQRQGQQLTLSHTDFEILKVLVLAYPNAVSKRVLNQKIWGDDVPESDALRSHVYTLRNSVDKPFDQALIKTVHGIGFKIDVSSHKNSDSK